MGLLSSNKARCVLGQLKDCRKIDQDTLTHLVKKEGLPKHDDPFGSGHWCFFESEILSWYKSRLAGDKPAMRGPGRPPRTNRAPEHRQVLGGSLTER